MGAVVGTEDEAVEGGDVIGRDAEVDEDEIGGALLQVPKSGRQPVPQ